MLNNKEVARFKETAKKVYGLDLTEAEAQGNRLVTLFELLIKIDRKNKQKEHEENKKVQD